jgi:hypothetical protein
LRNADSIHAKKMEPTCAPFAQMPTLADLRANRAIGYLFQSEPDEEGGGSLTDSKARTPFGCVPGLGHECDPCDDEQRILHAGLSKGKPMTFLLR